MNQQDKMALHILHLEDNPTDAELIKSLLEEEHQGCRITCVRTRPEFMAALQGGQFDLIISDYTLPGFNGLAALEIARQKVPDCPLIFLSGTIGEEAAIESLKRGATDYVLKDRPGRLAEAVRRALREVKEKAEKKQLEEQFLRAQRMEAIGALASGIAHDLNNTFVPILIGVELLREKRSGEDMDKMLETMRISARRGIDMVKRIVSFARGVSGEQTLLEVGHLVEEMKKLATETFPRSIKIRTEMGKDLYPVKGNATQLHQVLLNLCINARDAMPKGGSLLLAAENCTLENKVTPWYAAPASGCFVMLTVSDTGHGMPAEVLSQIFEPFFTTKDIGKGTGLGLSTVQGIVKGHGGFMEISSAPGQGTVFKVYLPVAATTEELAAPSLAT